MANPTANHSLNRPAVDTRTDWPTQTNANWDTLDTILQNISTDGTSFTPDSVSTEVFNNTVYTIGSGGKYPTLEAAFSDITDASASNRYLLALTDDITETEQVVVKPYISVYGFGHKAESEFDEGFSASYSGSPFVWDTVHNATWRDIDLVNDPATSTPSRCGWIAQQCERSLLFDNVAFAGQNDTSGGMGAIVQHDTHCRFSNCRFIGGDGGSDGHGAQVRHGSHATFDGCEAYAGNGSTNDCHAWVLDGSITATFNGCEGYSGTAFGSDAWHIVGSAAPTLNGCKGGPQEFSQFVNLTGDGSDVVDDGFPLDEYTDPEAVTGFPSYLKSIHIKLVNPVAGATLDIGTSEGGSQIASGVTLDGSANDRIYFDFTPKAFGSGDSIYFTASDQSAEYNPRYTIAVNQGSQYPLYLNTRGQANINGGAFASNFREPGGYIDTKATSASKYSIGGATFRTYDTSSDVGLEAASASGSVDPIEGVNAVGGYTNVVPKDLREATEDLGTSPTSAPTGVYPEGCHVRNSNVDNDETWVEVGGTWVQVA